MCQRVLKKRERGRADLRWSQEGKERKKERKRKERPLFAPSGEKKKKGEKEEKKGTQSIVPGFKQREGKGGGRGKEKALLRHCNFKKRKEGKRKKENKW